MSGLRAGLHTIRHLCVSEETKAAILVAAGGGLSAEEAAARLGVSLEALEALRGAGQLLAVAGPDGAWLYPAGQFSAAGVVPLLPELLRARMSPLSALSWLVAPSDVLDGRTALAVLREGEASEVATVDQMIRAMEADAYG